MSQPQNSAQTPGKSLKKSLAHGSPLLLAAHFSLLVLASWLVVRLLDLPLTELLTKVVTTTGAEWVMYVLIALSMLSGGVTFERWLFYRRRRVDGDAALERLRALLRDGDHAAAGEFLRGLGGMEGQVALACLETMDLGPTAMEEEMYGSLARARLEYDQNLVILGTLGNNAPFIGLFGTVLGIVKAFVDLAADISGGAEAVMAGISEALIATAIGLLVAIPSVIAYNALKARVKGVVTNTEALARTVMKHAKANREG